VPRPELTNLSRMTIDSGAICTRFFGNSLTAQTFAIDAYARLMSLLRMQTLIIPAGFVFVALEHSCLAILGQLSWLFVDNQLAMSVLLS
jgi:hypothetical protein